MRPYAWRLMAGGLWVLVAGPAALVAEPEQIAWAPSYAEAVQTARQTQKLMMVDFFTEW